MRENKEIGTEKERERETGGKNVLRAGERELAEGDGWTNGRMDGQLMWNSPLLLSKHGCLIWDINRVTYSNQTQSANKPTGC